MSSEKVKVGRKQFQGNIAVSVSDNEVRLWVCNDQGKNIFRFKATGKVHKDEHDIIVIGGQEK